MVPSEDIYALSGVKPGLPPVHYSVRVLYDQGIEYGWTDRPDGSAVEESRSFGFGGGGGILQGGIIFNIFSGLEALGSPGPELEIFTEISSIFTSPSFIYFFGGGAALRVLYTGIYIGYGYSYQKATFRAGGEEREINPGTVGIIGCFVDYPVIDNIGAYLGVHLYNKSLFRRDQEGERWERLSVRAGLSWRL